LTGRRKNGVRRQRDQLRRELAISIGIARGPTNFDPNVTADRPPGLLQTLQECRETGLPFRVVRREVHDHADAPRAIRLLRARRERPRRRAAEKCDERASPHGGLPQAQRISGL